MTVTDITAVETLVAHQCPTCQIWHGIPAALERRMKNDRGPNGLAAFCPKGHRWFFTGKTELERERAAREQAELAVRRSRESRDEALAAAEHERARVRGYQGAFAKVKKRVAGGECPAGCTERFADVAVHIAVEHPGYGRSSGES